MSEEDAALAAVTEYVYRRHSDLSASNVIGFDREELDRIELDGDGHLVFTVENVHVDEKETDTEGHTTWYISATLQFQVDDGGEPIEGSTDIYECYRCGDEWCIDWHSS